MKKIPKVHITQEWEKNAYVVEWLSKVGERTQKNYKERYPKWLALIVPENRGRGAPLDFLDFAFQLFNDWLKDSKRKKLELRGF